MAVEMKIWRAAMGELAQQMAVIREEMMKNGFTRRESVTIARRWFVESLLDAVRSNAKAPSFETMR